MWQNNKRKNFFRVRSGNRKGVKRGIHKYCTAASREGKSAVWSGFQVMAHGTAMDCSAEAGLIRALTLIIQQEPTINL